MENFTKSLNLIINNPELANRIIKDAIKVVYNEEEIKNISEKEKRAFVTYVLGQAAIEMTFNK